MAALPPDTSFPRVKSEPSFSAAVHSNGFDSESSGFRSRNGSSADSTRSSSPSPPTSAQPLTLLDKIQVCSRGVVVVATCVVLYAHYEYYLVLL